MIEWKKITLIAQIFINRYINEIAIFSIIALTFGVILALIASRLYQLTDATINHPILHIMIEIMALILLIGGLLGLVFPVIVGAI